MCVHQDLLASFALILFSRAFLFIFFRLPLPPLETHIIVLSNTRQVGCVGMGVVMINKHQAWVIIIYLLYIIIIIPLYTVRD